MTTKRNVRRLAKKRAAAPTLAPEAYDVPQLPAEARALCESLGLQRCFCAFYSCKKDDVLARVLAQAVLYTLPENSTCGLLDFVDERRVSRPEIRQHFLAGSPSLKVAGGGQSMHGSYLFISVPLPNQDASAEARAAEEVDSCAAFASLLHGEFVATERHFAATYDLQTGTCSQDSPGIYIRQTAEQEVLNQGLAVIIDRSDDSHLEYNATALSLLRRSHHERDATLKFLFLWLALESVLGNGRQRRHFALEVMQSEILNEIINRLRVRRDALLHDGLLIGLEKKDYLRIKCVLIIGLSQSHELRKGLLAYLEGALSD